LKTLAALLLFLALVAAPALAQTPDTVFLEELTWPELRAMVAAGKTTIILPIGGTEQNGPHMAWASTTCGCGRSPSGSRGCWATRWSAR
jgi:hypothetical protein